MTQATASLPPEMATQKMMSRRQAVSIILDFLAASFVAPPRTEFNQ